MSNQQLLFLIERKRIELVQVALKHGFSSPRAVACSQELDRMLNVLSNETKTNKKTLKY